MSLFFYFYLKAAFPDPAFPPAKLCNFINQNKNSNTHRGPPSHSQGGKTIQDSAPAPYPAPAPDSDSDPNPDPLLRPSPRRVDNLEIKCSSPNCEFKSRKI